MSFNNCHFNIQGIVNIKIAEYDPDITYFYNGQGIIDNADIPNDFIEFDEFYLDAELSEFTESTQPNGLIQGRLVVGFSKLQADARKYLYSIRGKRLVIIFTDSNGNSWLFGEDVPVTLDEISTTTNGGYDCTFINASANPIRKLNVLLDICWWILINTFLIINSIDLIDILNCPLT
jgi:hypothetical protein